MSRLTMGSFFCWLRARSFRRLGGAVLVLVVAGLVAGCGNSSFVGRQYENFTAYYNTFYNAQAAFEEGLESVDQSTPEVDRDQYISIFPEPQSGSDEQAFENAIQKCADLLREHPNSKWVDDALILIGRSYYYQQNFVGAAQKFREVVALDAEREGEARFRLAQTLLATERYADASEALAAALEGEEDYGPWTARMHLLRGELFARQENWEEAATALEQGLEGSVPDEVGARGALLLGQVRETLEEYEEAERAYAQVLEYNPRYPLEFAARLSAIEMEGLRGNVNAALDRLDELERGDDTQEMRNQMALVRARLYDADGRTEQARRILVETLQAEEAPSGEIRGGLHYELGALYRDAYEDFTQAAAHFDTAATSLSSPSGAGEAGGEEAERALPRAPSDAETQAERFRSLATRAQTVSRLDSLLRLGQMDPAEFQTFVEEVRKQRLAEQRARAEAQEQEGQQFQRTGTDQRRSSSGSQSGAVETRGSDAGFLFHQDPTLVQRGRRQFRQTWGDRPRTDNWRRQSDIQSEGAVADEEADPEEGPVTTMPGEQQGSESVVDVSDVPRDSASRAEMTAQRAVSRYELANALFRAASRPDSAETWYKKVLTENEDHPVARQALYALAQAHRAQGDSAVARETYRRVIEEYPGTSFAKRSRQQLGLDPVESAADLTASKADSAYTEAYAMWQRRNARGSALDAFLEVAETYPETDAAPRALLAAGVVYHQTIQQDSTSKYVPQWRLEQALDRLAVPDTSGGSRARDTTDALATGATAGDTASSPNSADTAAVDTATAGAAVGDSLVTPRMGSPSADSAVADTARESPTSPARADSAEADPAGQLHRPRRTADSTTASSDSADVPTPDSVQGETASSPVPASDADSLDESTSPDLRAWQQRANEVSVSPDTLAAGDSTLAPFAEAVTIVDSWGAADSTAAGWNLWSSITEADAERIPPTVSLRQLLSHLADQYPEAPEAKRAQLLLERLPDPDEADFVATDSAATDSTTSLPTDSAATPDTTTADSTLAPQRTPADTTQRETVGEEGEVQQPVLPRDTTAAPASDSTTAPTPSDSIDADSEASGRAWTLLVGTFEEAPEASQRRRELQKQLEERWSVTVFRDSTASPPRHRLIVGRFDSEEAADRARARLTQVVSGEVPVWVLPPADGRPE